MTDKKITTKVSDETYQALKESDESIASQLRQGADHVLNGPEYAVEIQPEIQERIRGHSDTPAAFIRAAVAEKLARENNHKRHLNANESISMNFTDFEARFIGDVLWEASDKHKENPNTQIENEYRWMARRFHAECKTREEAFDK